MISLTRLDGKTFHLNPDFIVTIEEAPDTVLHLSSGTSLMVLEKSEEIVRRIQSWHARLGTDEV